MDNIYAPEDNNKKEKEKHVVVFWEGNEHRGINEDALKY